MDQMSEAAFGAAGQPGLQAGPIEHDAERAVRARRGHNDADRRVAGMERVPHVRGPVGARVEPAVEGDRLGAAAHEGRTFPSPGSGQSSPEASSSTGSWTSTAPRYPPPTA